MDLFSRAGQERLKTAAPLAARMRPSTLDEFTGQDYIIGPLMVSGFVGTLISPERAVALNDYRQRRAIYYLALLLAALGAMVLFLPSSAVIPRLLSTMGALGLVLIFVIVYRTQPITDHLLMAIGPALWLVGNSSWLADWPVFRVAPWGVGFLVLTIAGERLELSRMLSRPRSAHQYESEVSRCPC